jgi:DNA recombination protein RmuC
MEWVTFAIIAAAGLAVGAGVMHLVKRAEGATLKANVGALSEKFEDLQTELAQSKTETEARRDSQQQAEINRERAQGLLEEKATRAAEMERQVAALNESVTKLSAEKSELSVSLKNQAEAHAAQTEALTTIRGEIEKDLKNLASDALKSNQTSFLEMANQVLDKHKETASGDLEKRQEAIKTLLQPISSTLEEYQKNLGAIEKARHESYGNLSKELQTVIQTQTEVRTETSKLVNALRAAPKTRGRWGEETLKNVMEMSGMSQFCDFTVEKSFDTEDGRLRPDVIIHLPGERSIVVDAKTSTSAYMDAVEATEDTDREAYLTTHAKQIRTHMGQLSSKSYHDGLTVTPDFVAMFIPGDNFFSAAMERDPSLFEDAIAKQVLIVTPTTLIALAKAIAFGWRQEKVADNARHVAELGRDLYKRLSVMGNHVAGMGGDIERLSKRYNTFVGSLETSVMPQARKFNELDVEGTAKALDDLAPLGTEIREVRTDRDMIFPENDDVVKQLEPRK